MLDRLSGWVAGYAQQIGRLYPSSLAASAQASIAATSSMPVAQAEMYAMLRSYYSNNSLYDRLSRALYDVGIQSAAMRGLRNPAFRVVEFYVASIWPGPIDRALPIQADSDAVAETIRQVWTWSNWGAKKQVFARTVPMLGDGWIKVVTTDDRKRVYFQLVEPERVTDFDTDERGYVVYCRIDTPNPGRGAGIAWGKTHTEVWDKAEQTVKTWLHERPAGCTLDDLGTPDTTDGFPLGIDFVPIVQCKFRDVGEDRGVGAFTLQLDKINEVNRKATRLGQQLFRSNAATWVITSTGVDREGRPMPALRPTADGTPATALTLKVGDDPIHSLPGSYDLKSMVPDIDWRASIDAVLADLTELGQDLPEMAYWQIPEIQGDASGRALRVKLIPAMARAEEARANLEEALVRADQMALSIGIAAGIFKPSLGSYESGAFDHSFDDRDVIPLSDMERWQAEVQKWTAAGLQKTGGVPTDQILKEREYTDEEIAAFAQKREADQAALDESLGALMDKQLGATVPVNPNQQRKPNPNGGANGQA